MFLTTVCLHVSVFMSLQSVGNDSVFACVSVSVSTGCLYVSLFLSLHGVDNDSVFSPVISVHVSLFLSLQGVGDDSVFATPRPVNSSLFRSITPATSGSDRKKWFGSSLRRDASSQSLAPISDLVRTHLLRGFQPVGRNPGLGDSGSWDS